MNPNRLFLATVPLLLALAGCGGGDTRRQDTDPSAGLARQLEALERSGALPALDRSTDIRGPDADNNGIRDDIDAWIAVQPITEAQKKALRQDARVMQVALLIDLSDKAALDRHGEAQMASVVCLHNTFESDPKTASAMGARIEAITANTRERARRYLAYNRAVSGSSGTLPDGDTCEP